jgi:hypothetical protein
MKDQKLEKKSGIHSFSNIFCFNAEYNDVDRLETLLASDPEYIHNIMKEKTKLHKNLVHYIQTRIIF